MKYKLAHACIRVMDLDKSIIFYTKALNLQVTKRKDYPEYEFTLVYLSDEDKHFEIELTYNYDPKKPYTIGNGFGHFALYVDDLEKSHKFHKDCGYEVEELTGLPEEKPHFYFLKDPDGFNIEIIRS